MRAFHSFWSKPNRIRNPEASVEFPDFEILTMMLSALEWRKHNGEISMITDTEGAMYFRGLGLEGLWDHLETRLDEIGDAVDPFLFWAGGKLFALKQMELPCVMLDTDLIIWKNVDWVRNHDLVAAHPENLMPHVYPHYKLFRFHGDYALPAEWDFSLQAANTAFLYMTDTTFRDAYADAAISFFQHVDTEGLNPVTAMCFAEQRILPMIAKQYGKDLGYLLSLAKPEEQDYVTHTWGYKNMFRQVPQAREAFCQRCVDRILREFPEMQETLEGIELLRKYKMEL